MRAWLWCLVGGLTVAQAAPVLAQQGSIRISSAVQALSGDPQQLTGQNRVEPDVGVSWLQPGTRLGTIQLDLRAARRGDRLHPGQTLLAFRDLEHAGLTWSLEGGDSYFSPAIGDYKFSNLFTPTVTFSGAAVTGRSERTTLSVVAGRATAWRNIFGSDADTLEQTLGLARATHKASDRMEINVRASRVRTANLKEFGYTIDASDQSGAGLKYAVTPDLQLVGDGSLVRYRRVGTTTWAHDGSALVGANWLHSRGWLQVNASRFSPGESPTLNSPLPDRESVFTAGEYDVRPRIRVFAGWELFRSNLDPEASAASERALPRTNGSRQFGGVRLQVGSRSTLTLRVEDGARVSRPILEGLDSDSDTGSVSTEWHTGFARFNGFARYARRENVDRARTEGSFTQHDTSAQVFANLNRSAQIFGLTTFTYTEQQGGGNSYWQAGGGAQVQVSQGNLWFRTEGTISRNLDLLTERLLPRESLNLGINGQLTPSTTLGFNIFIDRAPLFSGTGSPWSTRSMVRVTHSLRTGGAAAVSPIGLSAAAAERGTGAIRGVVFADWNANGMREADEGVLEGIPMRVVGSSHAVTGRNGDFAFLGIPVGVQAVGLDVGALPVDYDPPAVADVQVDLARHATTRLSFGLIPLGTIRGRLLRDTNGNGKPDADEPVVDGAVVILDAGARSEQTRRGAFAFQAVRSGSHTVTVLLDSLPTGAAITGPAEQTVAIGREQLEVDIAFLVSIEQRPEIRRVFPGGSGGRSEGAPRRKAPAARPGDGG